MSNYDDSRPVVEEVIEEEEPRSFLQRFWWILPLLALLVAIPFLARGCNRNETPAGVTTPGATGLFEIVDHGDPGWGTILRETPATFDAALFGWGSTSTSPNNAESTFITGGTNNIGGFSDPEVDRLWGEITTATDEATVNRLTTEMEAKLFNDGSARLSSSGLAFWLGAIMSRTFRLFLSGWNTSGTSGTGT